MPYIKQDERDRLNRLVSDHETVGMVGVGIRNAGQLNYVISQLIVGYLVQHTRSYQTFNDIVGALEDEVVIDSSVAVPA